MQNGFADVFPKTRIYTVGGGKGGVGKSIIAANIACLLAKTSKRVILIDADFGGANVHLNVGVKYPAKTLNNFLYDESVDIKDILLETPIKNLYLISGATGIYGLADPRAKEKQRMKKAFGSLSADYIIVDIGAGTQDLNIDFFNLSQRGIIVLTNHPTSVENAYTFLKSCIIKRILDLFAYNSQISDMIKKMSNPQKGGSYYIADISKELEYINPEYKKMINTVYQGFRPVIVNNMVKTKNDISFEKKFRSIAKRYLNIDLIYAGYIVYDHFVEKSIRQIKPLCTYNESIANSCFDSIIKNLKHLES